MQAIVDFLANIIQKYQYISCVYQISVQLYLFENLRLVITQQFLVLHKGVQQQTNAAYQKSMFVVTAHANLIIMSYHFITEDPRTYMWTSSLSVVSAGYYHTTTDI